VCPRVNPARRRMWHWTGCAKLIRSSTPPVSLRRTTGRWPHREDIDGDGRILSMRVPDRTDRGNSASRTPRHPPCAATRSRRRPLLQAAAERSRRRLRWSVNCRLAGKDSDLNRNFPAFWRALSRWAPARFDFRPEIARDHRFHRAAPSEHHRGSRLPYLRGVLLRPYSHLADEQMPPETCGPYQKMARKAHRSPAIRWRPAYHEFRYHPRKYHRRFRFLSTTTAALTSRVDGGNLSPQRRPALPDYQYHRLVS